MNVFLFIAGWMSQVAGEGRAGDDDDTANKWHAEKPEKFHVEKG